MKHVIAFLCLCFSFTGLSQPINRVNPITARNTVYIEALGSGGVYSVNYERLLKLKEQIAYGFRVGTAYTGSRPGNLVLIGELFTLLGEDNLHADFGIGLTSGMPLSVGIDSLRAKTEFLVVPRIGYRYQRPTGGLMARIGFTPLIPIGNANVYDRFYAWAGLSIGYSF